MENIVVDPSSGLVGISSMIKCADPGANPGSILRSVNSVLQDAPFSTNKRAINKKSTVVADLTTCNYVIDNLPGRKWDAWRQESGEEFKRSLAEHVERVRTVRTTVPEPTYHGGDLQDEIETKSSVLQKSLRTVGIIGSVRVNEASNKCSVIDVINLLSPSTAGDYANKALSRVIDKDRDDQERSCRDDGTSISISPSIADRVDYIQINGKGRTTPVADAKTIVEIIWLLPARVAREFRRQSAETICRVLSGDTSICAEIESRCAELQSSEEGRNLQNFMSGESSEAPAKRARIGPEIMELATEEQYQQFVTTEVEHQLQAQRLEKADALEMQCLQQAYSQMSAVMKFKEAFEQIRPLEPRETIELCDRITDIQHRTFRRMAAMNSTTSPPTDAVVVATPTTLATSEPTVAPTDPGISVPTPECHSAVRGDEISIAMVSTQLCVGLGEKAGQVGKKMKALYAARYGSVAAANIPKRTTIFRGKPFQENTYYARDKDLMEQAISEVASRT